MNCRLVNELLTYSSANRLLITGTPLQNNIKELWSLLHFLLPDIFNDLSSFESWFDFSSVLDSGGQTDAQSRPRQKIVTTMHSILKPFLLRRVKSDVETSLPRKREYILYAPLTMEQKDLYREILNGTGRQFLESKAVERIAAKSGTGSKRRRAGSVVTPTKRRKSSHSSTPSSNLSRAGRRRTKQNYKELTDHEFDVKLQNLENGIEEDESADAGPSDTEQEQIERAKTIKLASQLLKPIDSFFFPSRTNKISHLNRKGNIYKKATESRDASSSCLRFASQLLLAMECRRRVRCRRNACDSVGENEDPRSSSPLPALQGPQDPDILPIQNAAGHPRGLGEGASLVEMLSYRWCD